MTTFKKRILLTSNGGILIESQSQLDRLVVETYKENLEFALIDIEQNSKFCEFIINKSANFEEENFGPGEKQYEDIFFTDMGMAIEQNCAEYLHMSQHETEKIKSILNKKFTKDEVKEITKEFENEGMIVDFKKEGEIDVLTLEDAPLLENVITLPTKKNSKKVMN